jgi:hypothetical protein
LHCITHHIRQQCGIVNLELECVTMHCLGLLLLLLPLLPLLLLCLCSLRT